MSSGPLRMRFFLGPASISWVPPPKGPAARPLSNPLTSEPMINSLFGGRTLRHFLIVAGHDVAPCVFQGAIPGAWH